jgi:hypothetical protein
MLKSPRAIRFSPHGSLLADQRASHCAIAVSSGTRSAGASPYRTCRVTRVKRMWPRAKLTAYGVREDCSTRASAGVLDSRAAATSSQASPEGRRRAVS